MSRKDYIKSLFVDQSVELTCQQITKKIIEKDKLEGNVALYLSGSVTTILAQLVVDKFLQYAEKKTARGGHIYTLNEVY